MRDLTNRTNGAGRCLKFLHRVVISAARIRLQRLITERRNAARINVRWTALFAIEPIRGTILRFSDET
jgi:hypothetical protein